jgi:predicted RNA-binding protein
LRVCDANAYLVRDGAEETLLESVDLVEMDGDEAKLINIFGERKVVRARAVTIVTSPAGPASRPVAWPRVV